MQIQIYADPKELARGAAQEFVARGVEAVAQGESFTVALSGGSTPKLLYQLLADGDEPFRDRVPWRETHFFWSDERNVPPDHPDSNHRMTNEAMLAHVPVPPGNIHRIHGEKPDVTEAAGDYERNLIEVTEATLPRLDLILLGLGPDGHTASIFPGSEVLHETQHLVAAPWVAKLNTYRITMTLPLLNNAASILFLVSGAEKAEIVREVLEGPKQYPAQYVKPTNGELLWLLDKDSAKDLARGHQ